MPTLKANNIETETVRLLDRNLDYTIHDDCIEVSISKPVNGALKEFNDHIVEEIVNRDIFRIPKNLIIGAFIQYIKPEVMMSESEEVLRLKLTIINMIYQFYDVVNPENYKDYIESCGMTYNPDEDYYFHQFESAGEKAWSSLGFENCIITGKELYSLSEEMRNKLLEIDLEKKGLKKDEC